MIKHLVAGVVGIVVAWAVVPASAQDARRQESTAQAARSPAQSNEQVQARYHIFVMEGVLERAVDHGADLLRRQVRRLMPDMLLLSGGAEARGFRLEGYGVFFDVEVPVMRRSMAWSLRTMIEDQGTTTSAALQQLKAAIERMAPDAAEKAALLQAVRRLEMQVAPAPALAGPPGLSAAQRRAERGGVVAMEAPAEAPALAPEDAALLEDPNGAYERSVISALIDAMLEHSTALRVGPDEWLTVAARDNEHRNRLVPGDPYDLLTIILRVKGSDLAAFRAGRMPLEDARRRVEVREF